MAFFSIFAKRGQSLESYPTQSFENFSPGISVAFGCSSPNFRYFRLSGSLSGNSIIYRFSPNFPGKFRTILFPFRNCENKEEIVHKFNSFIFAQVIRMLEEDNKRLERPEACPEHTYSLMLQCWDLKPEKRPTFAELHNVFSTNPFYADVKLPIKGWSEKSIKLKLIIW